MHNADPAPAALLAVFSLLWAAAVWFLTPAYDMPQALFHGFSHTGRLRLWARGLQAGWVLAAGAAFLRQAATKTAGGGLLPTLLGSTSVLGIAIGLAGIVVLAIQLRRLAEWARDGNAERAFNLTAWGIPITTPLLLVNLPILLLGLALGLIWVTSVCAFVLVERIADVVGAACPRIPGPVAPAAPARGGVRRGGRRRGRGNGCGPRPARQRTMRGQVAV